MAVSLGDVIEAIKKVEADKESTSGKATNVTVGTSSTTVLEANPRRKPGTCITNDDDEEIYLAKGEIAVMNKGMRLNPNGQGVWYMTSEDLYKGKITAICASGSKNLCVEECE